MTRLRVLAVVCLISLGLLHNFAAAQSGRSGIVGHVNDSAGAVVQHARVELQPGGIVATTGDTGDFTISDLAPGDYTLTVSYVGFSVFSSRVRVGAGEPVRVNAVLQLGTQNESVTVHADRQGGEAEALDIERTADNIVQVLPADVITSLPNTNIADALGRLPSVSLERDEGEGKYVQIRGTEPRLSNVTVNGIHLPSPEGVRNVKLDAIPADLVESVEINKTLSANQDADAIGGSVNLVTRSPADQPYVSLMGMGGYTPITGGRELHQFAGTAGQRFGQSKKFGALFGFSYDYNARGIDDLEPGPAINTFTPDNGTVFVGPPTADLRNYHYDRSRYGFDGDLDYRLGEMSSVYLRGLFSHFNDNGEDWIYSPAINVFPSNLSDPTTNTCGLTNATAFGNPTGCGGVGFKDIYRKPAQQLVSVQAGARHAFGKTLLIYEAALSESSYTGGFSFSGFDGRGAADNSVAFAVDTRNPFVPKFPVLNGVNIYDPAAYTLAFADTEKDGIFERDVVGDISLSRQYSLGGHFSTFELGFKGWDASKTSVVDRENFNSAGGQPMTQFLGNYRDNNYYFHQLTYGPTTSFNKIRAALEPGGTSPDLGTNIPNDWDISERIWAGYAMDTINLGNFRLQAGVRVESTSDDLLGNTFTNQINQFGPVSKAHSYTDVFPSVQAQYRLDSDTILRAAYGIGIARPNFQDIAPYQSYDPTASNFPVTAGNPNLLPTRAQNFDLLAEHYFGSLGIIQGGVFYKSLTNPIYFVDSQVPPGFPNAGLGEVAPINGPSAHIVGFEAAWQQRLTFLPGALNSMGVSANYGHTTSRASFPAGAGRTDHPTLLRTAPNNWNFDVTYDKKAVSARMGLSHNDANLWSYGGSNAKDPSGDLYLYPHTQVDAQVSYWIPRARGLQAIVSGLNLNNEVFGFYLGAERYPIQREYYSRTFSAGLRWTLGGEPH
ncbi:MAG: TonB-dependent receptor [Acidobacteriaceae bacterium]|nr:TonB-dependent receptor [Acidobacteriaceae bacterium]